MPEQWNWQTPELCYVMLEWTPKKSDAFLQAKGHKKTLLGSCAHFWQMQLSS